MIIFGWGNQFRKDYGPVIPHKCSNCQNDVQWHLLRSTVWFSLFFVPVLPYVWDHYLICPICQSGIKLNSSDTKKYKDVARLIRDEQKGLIPEGEFSKKYIALLGGDSEDEEKEIESRAREPEETKDGVDYDVSDEGIRFCVECGKSVEKDTNFCGSCGNKIVK